MYNFKFGNYKIYYELGIFIIPYNESTMQKYLFLIILIFSINGLTAQTLKKSQKDGLYGFINENKERIIDYQYQSVYDFYNEIAIVKKYSLWGFINTKNEIIVPIKYNMVQVYRTQNIVKAQENDLWYLFTLTGEPILNKGFEEIGRIYKDKMMVRKNDKFGLLGIDGKYIIRPKYQELIYKGRKMVKVKKRGKYGYKTNEGKRVIKIKYQELGKFYGSRVKAKHKDKWGILDSKGKRIIKFRFDYIGKYTYDTYLQGYYAPYVFGSRVGKISSWGASVPFEYTEVADETKRINDKMILILFGEDYGVVDNKGKVIINTLYSNPIVFSEGVAAVLKEGKYGFINKKGEMVYPFILEKAENFKDGKASVIKDEEQIFLTKSDLN